MVRALDKADAMLSLSSPQQYREPFTIFLLTVRADLPERCCISVPPVINNIYRSAVPAQKYLPERRSA